jgi:hypothetical protein
LRSTVHALKRRRSIVWQRYILPHPWSRCSLGKADKKKWDLYSQLPNHYLFCPFAEEILGTLGEDALEFVRNLEDPFALLLAMHEKPLG